MTWLAIVPIFTSASLTVFFIDNAEWMMGFAYFDWAIFFALSVLSMALAFTPTTYLCLVSGYFLGLESLMYLVLAYQAASTVGYFLSKYLDHDLFGKLIEQFKGGRALKANVHKNDFLLTILCRLSPGLPFAVMNVALSITGVRFSRFFWGGLVGMLPRTVFFTWVGSQAAQIQNAFENKEGVLWILIPTLLVFVAIYFLLKPSRLKIH